MAKSKTAWACGHLRTSWNTMAPLRCWLCYRSRDFCGVYLIEDRAEPGAFKVGQTVTFTNRLVGIRKQYPEAYLHSFVHVHPDLLLPVEFAIHEELRPFEMSWPRSWEWFRLDDAGVRLVQTLLMAAARILKVYAVRREEGAYEEENWLDNAVVSAATSHAVKPAATDDAAWPRNTGAEEGAKNG